MSVSLCAGQVRGEPFETPVIHSTRKMRGNRLKAVARLANIGRDVEIPQSRSATL
jgi:hypothetical protein